MEIRIANIYIRAANTEYRWVIPKGCMWFVIRERNRNEIRFALVSNVIAGKQPDYMTLPAAEQPLQERNLNSGGQLVYFAAPNGSRVVEVLMGIREEVDA